MVNNNYFGVLTKDGKDFKIFTYCSDVNLSEKLRNFWQKDIPVHIKIETNNKRLLDESKCELYYDRDKNREYKLHINGINIEEILQKSIGKQLDITITHEIGDRAYGTELLYQRSTTSHL